MSLFLTTPPPVLAGGHPLLQDHAGLFRLMVLSDAECGRPGALSAKPRKRRSKVALAGLGRGADRATVIRLWTYLNLNWAGAARRIAGLFGVRKKVLLRWNSS